MKTQFSIITILLMFIFNPLFSQEDVKIIKKEFVTEKKGDSKALKDIKYGDYFYKENNEGSYLKALNFYLSANEYNPENAELNYKIGVCYLESINKNLSLTYLQKSYELKENVAGDIFYQLGRAYHYNYQFTLAIEYYEKYISLIRNDIELEKKLNKKIEECQNGKEIVKDTSLVHIRNIEIVNSQAKDYSPLITADGEKMIFTSRRQNTTGGQIDINDNQYYEDIFFSSKKDSKWTQPENIGSPLNTISHDATVGLSTDGQMLITYFFGDLYISKLE